MHREDNSKYLLYIEPEAKDKSDFPVNDRLTELMRIALDNSKIGASSHFDKNCKGYFTTNSGFFGTHRTECGQWSTSRDYLLGNGMITNSLCVFYLQYYRNSIPKSEMDKVEILCEWVDKKILSK